MTKLKSIGVYCSASKNLHKAYVQVAKETGELIAAQGADLVYGGGRRGLMGIVANSAMAAGGKVIGYMPTYLAKGEEAHREIDELHLVPDMQIRKRSIFERSDALVVLPGGFGTLDEFFEVLLLKQIRLHSKPMVIVNTRGFWTPLRSLIRQIVDQNFAGTFVWDLVEFIEDIDDLPNALQRQLDTKLPEDKWGAKGSQVNKK